MLGSGIGCRSRSKESRLMYKAKPKLGAVMAEVRILAFKEKLNEEARFRSAATKGRRIEKGMGMMSVIGFSPPSPPHRCPRKSQTYLGMVPVASDKELQNC